MPESETLEIEVEREAAEPEPAEGHAADPEPDQGEDTAASEPEPAKSDLEQAREELETARQEALALKDRLLRAQAEFENTRKRLQREKEESLRYAEFDMVSKLLPVMDDFEKAIGSKHAPAEVRQGLEQIQSKFFGVFERAGLKEVDQHETFDPRLHEALSSAPATDEQADQQILEVWRKGYVFRDRLMRASWVKVAVKE